MSAIHGLGNPQFSPAIAQCTPAKAPRDALMIIKAVGAALCYLGSAACITVVVLGLMNPLVGAIGALSLAILGTALLATRSRIYTSPSPILTSSPTFIDTRPPFWRRPFSFFNPFYSAPSRPAVHLAMPAVTPTGHAAVGGGHVFSSHVQMPPVTPTGHAAVGGGHAFGASSHVQMPPVTPTGHAAVGGGHAFGASSHVQMPPVTPTGHAGVGGVHHPMGARHGVNYGGDVQRPDGFQTRGLRADIQRADGFQTRSVRGNPPRH